MDDDIEVADHLSIMDLVVNLSEYNWPKYLAHSIRTFQHVDPWRQNVVFNISIPT